MSFEEIYAAMSKIVESMKTRGLLEAYETDFTVHDRNSIEKDWSDESRWIWVITPNGTHLTEIGVHPKQNSWAEATIQTGYKNFAIFLLTKNGVKEITKEKAFAEIKKMDFHIQNNVICNSSGDKLAYMQINPRNHQARQGGQVRFTLAENKHYTNRLKHILSVIATSEMAKYYGSWFSCVDDIVFAE